MTRKEMVRRGRALLFSTLIATLSSGAAHAQLVPYYDPRTGYTTYSNIPPTGMESPTVSTEGADSTGGAQRSRVLRHASRPYSDNKKSASIPDDYPKVSAMEQRNRDKDRRAILMDEMQFEKAELARAEKSAGPLDISRHKKNLESLQRELANVE